ncbi:autotransporter outer membrane beta-barrel domain-containing protein [Hyphomicrobium sp.]|jgi:fibronectin-binding autotransporter adhesin|uniref:autotransporter family protein n=1 Tax=Hyphomicrobium sp. TaxID=82 RepID=UPI003567DD67
MMAGMGRAGARVLDTKKGQLLAGLSCAVLATAFGLPTPSSAGNYTASTDGQLRAAITQANADPDPNATITLTGSFSTSAISLPTATKPITIDTGAFILSGTSGSGASSGSPIIFTGAGGVRTLAGTFVGGSANLGTGGTGVQIRLGASVTNNGLVEGGTSTAGSGGAGVDLGGTGTGTTLVNHGTIRGGAGATGGGVGIIFRAGTNPIVNTGTIEGGAGASAITLQTGTTNYSITNSGTIRAGAGQSGAIRWTGTATTGALTLELQASSVIDGNVVANAASAADVFRLGGTANDVFDVSTIGSQYQNFDNFQKTGTSTWALVGTGTATTDWQIQDGTLQLGNGGTSGSVVGTITTSATGTLAFDRSDALTFDNLVLGTGTIRQIGSGTTTMTADNSAFAGTTSVEAGALAVNGILGGTLNVLSGGRLQGTGQVGTTTNVGVIAPGNGSIGTLTVAGDYTGNGGTLAIESVLGGDASATDRLVVTGSTAGATQVVVNNLGGAGGQTVAGIKVVDVEGASNGTFALRGDYVFHGDQAVIGGAYAYRLYEGGVSTLSDGDWYLRSALIDPGSSTPSDSPPAPLYQPGVAIYESYANVLQTFNTLGTLQQRTGNRSWGGASGSDTGTDQPGMIEGNGVWARIEGSHSKFDPKTSTSGADFDADYWDLQAGVDGVLLDAAAGRLIGSWNARYGTISSDISSIYGLGGLNSDGYGFGGTLTWYGRDGFYVDGQSSFTLYDSNLSSNSVGRLIKDDDGSGYAFSLEAGQNIAVAPHWSLVPQAQLSYSKVSFDGFNDPFGARVTLDHSDDLTGRIGLALDHVESWRDGEGRISRAKLYGISNLYYDFLDGSKTDVSGVAFRSENDDLWGGLGVGGSLNWANDAYSIYGEVSGNTSLNNFGDSYAVSGTGGFRMKW